MVYGFLIPWRRCEYGKNIEFLFGASLRLTPSGLTRKFVPDEFLFGAFPLRFPASCKSPGHTSACARSVERVFHTRFVSTSPLSNCSMRCSRAVAHLISLAGGRREKSLPAFFLRRHFIQAEIKLIFLLNNKLP